MRVSIMTYLAQTGKHPYKLSELLQMNMAAF